MKLTTISNILTTISNILTTMMNELRIECYSDCSWVIGGVHLTKEQAQDIANKEDPNMVVDHVKRVWERLEYMSDEEIEDESPMVIPEKRPRWWVLYEYTTRPAGITRKATVCDISFL
jgi:hypothetical protein